MAAALLLLVFLLQASDLRADLLFRSAAQIDGEQQWSAPRSYADPAQTAYPRVLADGSQLSSEEVQVFLEGEITQQDVYSAKVMESLVKRGRQKLSANTVRLSGSGGDADAAMEIGRVLRRLGVSTLVASGEQCLSSCVFAFMGGDRRTVAGRMGIHRPYFLSTRDVRERRSYYRQLQQRLRQYMEELDFPPSLYEAVMAVPPEAISLLSAAELKKYYLHGMSPAAEDEADATAARNLGLSLPDYLARKAQSESCGGVIDSGGACADRRALAGSAAEPDPNAKRIDRNPAPATGAALVQEQEKTDGAGATRGAVAAPAARF